MYALVERETKSGQKKYEKITGIITAIFFDESKSRPKIQVDPDCCVRSPVTPKDVEKFK